MRAICVDDEAILLQVLKKSVEQSPDIDEAVAFSNGKSAIEYAQKNPIDIAFLDIEIHKMNGIELATKLREIHPKLPVVFCTGYSQYALDAFKIHANGYLTKPIRPDDVQEQIDNIKETFGIGNTPKLTVQCFGNFEVYFDGKPLAFKRSKSKEMLAYLIDRQGAVVTTGQIATALWEDELDEKSLKNYLYQVQYHLKAVLSEIGMDGAIIKSSTGYAVNTEMLDCDYYKYLENPDNYTPAHNEYMYQYSWAEETNADLFGF